MATTTTIAKRSGTRISREALDRQLDLHGWTQRELARRAGVHEVIISRARRGQPVTQTTLRKIVSALVGGPLLAGADLILENETAGAAAAPAIPKEVEAGGELTDLSARA